MPREWDATTYDGLALPHESWGRRVLDRMVLTGDERVLDAGCGTGRDAAALLGRWPHARVVALDASAQMLEVARGRLGDAVDYVQADLVRPLAARSGGPVEGAVDAVLSVAAFHWVPDHDLLFAHLAELMRPGARLTSDCGGRGNLAAFNLALASVTGEEPDGWEFAGAEDTRDRLVAAGFEVERVRLRPDPFRCEEPEAFDSFLATVILGSLLDELPQEDRGAFVREVRLALAEPVVDYVRLEIDAVRR